MAKIKIDYPDVEIIHRAHDEFDSMRGPYADGQYKLYDEIFKRFPLFKGNIELAPELFLTAEKHKPQFAAHLPPHQAGFFDRQMELARQAAVDAKNKRRIEQQRTEIMDEHRQVIFREQQELRDFFAKKLKHRMAYMDHREVLMARSERQTEYIAKKSDQHIVNRHQEQGKMWEEMHLKQGGHLPSQLPPQNQQDGNTLADNLLEKAIREKQNLHANLNSLLPLTAAQAIAVFQMIGYNVATRAPGVAIHDDGSSSENSDKITAVTGSNTSKI